MKIFISFLVFALSFIAISQQQQVTNSTSCYDLTPSTQETCTSFKSESSNDYCCYLQGIRNNNGEKRCHSVPKVSYDGRNFYNYKGKQYSIVCPVQPFSKPPLEGCGLSTDKTQSDCSVSSSFAMSCCYYNGEVSTVSPVVAEKGCYWLGLKYFGKLNWATMELDCNSTYLSFASAIAFALSLIIF